MTEILQSLSLKTIILFSVETTPATTTPHTDYVFYDNSPGCGEAGIEDSSECGVAAASLGFSAQVVREGFWSNYPPGCFLGKNTDGYKKTWFNTRSDGRTGMSVYRSVCHKDGKF